MVVPQLAMVRLPTILLVLVPWLPIPPRLSPVLEHNDRPLRLEYYIHPEKSSSIGVLDPRL